MLFICYTKCGTCRKAKKWLDSHQVAYTDRHILEENPTAGELKEWIGRSGLSLKHGITVLNTPGTIDEGYRGEIGVILINHGREAYKIEVGARIAQLC